MAKAREGLSFGPTVLIYAALVLFAAVILVPLAWGLDTSFKTPRELDAAPPEWFPDEWVMANYDRVWNRTSIPANIVNTAFISGLTTVITIFIGLHAAYAINRFKFRGRNFGMAVLLMSVMVPAIVTLVPQFLIAARLSLIDTRWVLIVIFTAWQIPFAVWILNAFLSRIPVELDEAALLDGCSPRQVLYRVILPVSLPGIASAAIVVFIWAWNEFIIALTMTATSASQPVAPGIFNFVGEQGVDWGSMTAAGVLAVGPAIVIFVLLQRQFVEGLTAGMGK